MEIKYKESVIKAKVVGDGVELSINEDDTTFNATYMKDDIEKGIQYLKDYLDKNYYNIKLTLIELGFE